MPGAVTGVAAVAAEVVALTEAACDAVANPHTAPPVSVAVTKTTVPAARQPCRVDPIATPSMRGPRLDGGTPDLSWATFVSECSRRPLIWVHVVREG
jgi:hypothetical protein